MALPSNIAPYVYPYARTGVFELIGINERVDQNRYSDEVAVAFPAYLGYEITKICLYSTEDGTGAVQRPNGQLFILRADPAIAVNASTLGAGAVWPTVVGKVAIAVADWSATDTGGAVCEKVLADPLHVDASTLWFVFFNEAAGSFNDAAGDDEQLEADVWYRAG